MAAHPGAELIEAGLADLRAGELSENALLVSIGAPRLRALGLAVPDGPAGPEKLLYARLAEQDPDSAHGRYNALVRRLVGYERSAGSR